MLAADRLAASGSGVPAGPSEAAAGRCGQSHPVRREQGAERRDQIVSFAYADALPAHALGASFRAITLSPCASCAPATSGA